MSFWTLGCLFYSLGNDPLLSLFVLLLKLSQYWPLGAPSCWLLCPFDMSPSVSEHVLDFWHHSIPGSSCPFPLEPWDILFFKEPWSEKNTLDSIQNFWNCSEKMKTFKYFGGICFPLFFKCHKARSIRNNSIVKLSNILMFGIPGKIVITFTIWVQWRL